MPSQDMGAEAWRCTGTEAGFDAACRATPWPAPDTETNVCKTLFCRAAVPASAIANARNPDPVCGKPLPLGLLTTVLARSELSHSFVAGYFYVVDYLLLQLLYELPDLAIIYVATTRAVELASWPGRGVGDHACISNGEGWHGGYMSQALEPIGRIEAWPGSLGSSRLIASERGASR